jgi:hypothetical protein
MCTVEGVAIDGPSSCAAERRHHVYEMNPRFGMIEARGGPSAIEARLQLAAIFAATGTALPEITTRQTGGEVAMELMRQCWKADPHTIDELEQLSSLHGLSRLTPGVALMAEELGTCARELRFLHPPTTGTGRPRPGRRRRVHSAQASGPLVRARLADKR